MEKRISPLTPTAVDELDALGGADLLAEGPDLFAEELEEHLSHAALHTLSTLFTASTYGCWCTLSSVCSFVTEEIPQVDGGAE